MLLKGFGPAQNERMRPKGAILFWSCPKREDATEGSNPILVLPKTRGCCEATIRGLRVGLIPEDDAKQPFAFLII